MGKYVEKEKLIKRAEEHLRNVLDESVTVSQYAKDYYELGYLHCVDVIKLEEAADVKLVVMGKWIFKQSDVYPWCDKAICSCCNEVVACDAKIAQDWGKIDFVSDNKFCPNCGAKMDDNVIQHTESVGNALGALDEVEELSRYIDANKMADELSKVPWYEREDEKQAVRMVKEFPTADVVEVVRCCDCRSFQCNMRQDGYLPEGVPEYECRWWCGETDPTDYCSHAKRKDGGQDDNG